MKLTEATELLAALGHETRLAIFRLLVEAGRDGMNASAIADRLGVPAPTLSFHLAHLARTGLVGKARDGRFIHYSTAYRKMDELIGFLTHNCCQGEPCLANTGEDNHDRREDRPGVVHG